MPEGKNDIYILDTSALVGMQNRLWPIEHFPDVWNRLSTLGDDGRLLVFDLVKEECEDEALVRWLGERPKIIVRPATDIEDCVKRVLVDLETKGKKLVDFESRESDADPFVIACAMAYNARDSGSYASGRYVLVQEEVSRKPSPVKVAIPDVCDWYGIVYIKPLDLVRRENWVFGSLSLPM